MAWRHRPDRERYDRQRVVEMSVIGTSTVRVTEVVQTVPDNSSHLWQ